MSTHNENLNRKLNEGEVASQFEYIIGIGSSTGGPKSLHEVIPYIPLDIPAAILIVQHMPPVFTKTMAERLNRISSLTVKEAEDGEAVIKGVVYIAPGDYHMTIVKDSALRGYRIKLDQDPAVGGHRPSVNVMMNSIAEVKDKKIIAVIMTGMGSDGSEGIKNIRKKSGGYIISQDEESCVVYGMPKMAVRTGVVDKVITLKEIANEIMKQMGVN